MDDRIARLESTVASLTSQVARLDARVRGLESKGGDTAEAPAVPAPGFVPNLIEGLVPRLPASTVQQWLALIGRTLVVLGGAYLLRALTAADVLPVPIGVAAGLLYGAPWLWLASRAGARGSSLDAFCHGLSTALIGYPLVWEATVRFGVFTPVESAAVLAGLTAAALLLSATEALYSLAGIVTCGAALTASALAMATGAWAPYAIISILLGLETLWLGYHRDWTLLRWPAAIVANLMVVVLTGYPGSSSALVVLGAQIGLVAGFLGSVAARTLVMGRPVGVFDGLQSAAVLLLGLGSLLSSLHDNSGAVASVGFVVLVVGVVVSGLAVSPVVRRGPEANLFFYTIVAVALVVTGTAIGLPEAAAVIFSVLGTIGAFVALKRRDWMILLQAVGYLFAAAIGSGLLAAAAAALVMPRNLWPALTLRAGVALAAATLALALPVPRWQRTWPLVISGLRLALVALVVSLLLGVAVMAGAAALPAAMASDAAWLATLRTALMAAATLLLSRAAATPLGREASWLTHPLVVAGGIKLLVSDFPQGRPITLFLALAAYGSVLIAAPRILRRSSVAAPAPLDDVRAATVPGR
jgi:hypothetical protein